MVSSIGGGLFTAGNFAQSLKNIYNVSDRNGDGFLSLSEFEESGNSISYAKGLIDAYDRNGDGKLSQAELIAGTLAALAGDAAKFAPEEESPIQRFRAEDAKGEDIKGEDAKASVVERSYLVDTKV